MKNNGIVCIGSNYFSALNISEAAQEENFQQIIYDRSVANLKISDLDAHLEKTVFDVAPAKIFLNIGDADIECDSFSVGEFISKYEWALFNLHRKCKGCRIYILSVVSDAPCSKELNANLKNVAENFGCDFIDIASCKNENSGHEIFRALKNYMRDFPIDFCEAMRCA